MADENPTRVDVLIGDDYPPAPIVDRKRAREEALDRYRL